MPSRCYYDVASSKWHLLALNGSETFAINDETGSESDVPVGRRSFARIY
jgi:hypothetical protein